MVKELTPEEQARKVKEENELKAYRIAKAKVEASAAQLKELFKEHPDAQTCANLIQHFWMGLFWGLNQIQTYVGMTNELVQHLSDASRVNAMQAQVPIPQLAAAIKNKSLPFMLQISREYEAEQTRRRAKLVKAMTRMPNGITVPVPQDQGVVPQVQVQGRGEADILPGAFVGAARPDRRGEQGCAGVLQVAQGQG